MQKSISVTDFGAVPDSCELQTEKIQSAIDACFLSGGGEVVIPRGVFLSGGIRLRSNITLHLMKGAILKGSRNPEDYFAYLHDTIEPLDADLITDAGWKRAEISENRDRDYSFMRVPGSRWNNALIRVINAVDVSIIGEEGSVLDGNDCFDDKGEENYRGPHCIGMFYCKNITLRGYSVKDSANWAHSLFYCENITAENVTVSAGHDGIHMTVCENVTIDGCRFYTGDDCIAGFANVNVMIRNCELNSACSAMRFGGTNVVVEKCRIWGPCKYLFRGCLTPEEKRVSAKPDLIGRRTNMLSVFTYYSDFSVPIKYQPGNIIISDCTVDLADRFLHYNFSGNELWQTNRPLESIRFENICASGIAMPLTAYGDNKVKVTLELDNVSVSFRKGSENTDFMHIANFKKVSLKNVKIENFHNDCLIKAWTDGNVELENLDCGVSDDSYVVMAQEKFTCQPI